MVTPAKIIAGERSRATTASMQHRWMLVTHWTIWMHCVSFKLKLHICRATGGRLQVQPEQVIHNSLQLCHSVARL